MEDEEKEDQQEEAMGSGERDTVLPTALLKGAVGSVATNGVTGAGVRPKHLPAVLKERPCNPYGLVPMSLVL